MRIYLTSVEKSKFDNLSKNEINIEITKTIFKSVRQAANEQEL